MSGFTLQMKTGNAAFSDEDGGDRGSEIGRILREAADTVEGGRTSGKLIDINGNIVGEWDIED